MRGLFGLFTLCPISFRVLSMALLIGQPIDGRELEQATSPKKDIGWNSDFVEVAPPPVSKELPRAVSA